MSSEFAITAIRMRLAGIRCTRRQMLAGLLEFRFDAKLSEQLRRLAF